MKKINEWIYDVLNNNEFSKSFTVKDIKHLLDLDRPNNNCSLYEIRIVLEDFASKNWIVETTCIGNENKQWDKLQF